MDCVGFIGLGLMGRPMALNLVKKGFPLTVYNRSRPPVEALVAAGAAEAGSPADAAARSDVVITIVPDAPDVRAVLEGPRGVFATIRPGSVIVDMSTIAPAAARDLAAAAASRGAAMLDAPVSGGEIGAINGTLSIMVGGDAEALERVRPVLAAVGHPDRIVHIGPPGAGQLCKACNQICIGGALASVAEAFAIARKAGIDPAKVREALLGGFAASRVLEVHGERILTGNYVPGFKTRLYHKDLGIVGQTIHDLQVPAPVAALVQQYVGALMAAGRGDEDYSALAKAVFEAAGLE
ncbi:MAG TPA: NAD(P)-dependent oxidoreductase [Vicinamibacterales bacterium]|mgnify:FL=1|nr:NAD(P)-dependent oxidoreductase [Vicinamibacterales bacterium]HPK72229.1 NAD(P)-dependent oxidoreductase [Vicinamibacterales bacterium]